MLEKIRTITKQKAQGIVEYALLLAFVVGIAMMLNGADLGGAIKGVFDDVATALGFERDYASVDDYASAVKNWGNKSNEELSNIDEDKRLTIDQEGLGNLAGFFIGKDRTYMQSLFNSSKQGSANTNQSFVLGWFNNDEPGGASFTASSEYFGDAARADIESHIFNWLQHDYGTFSNGTIDSYDDTKSYSSGTKYLFSDYALNNTTGSKFGEKNYDRGGIKVKLQYDNSGTVVAAKVVMDSTNTGSSAGADASYGMNATVKNGTTTYGGNDFNKNF